MQTSIREVISSLRRFSEASGLTCIERSVNFCPQPSHHVKSVINLDFVVTVVAVTALVIVNFFPF